MSWANLAAIAIGSLVAVVGGLHNVPGLLALGGTIVGGVLGNAMPGRPNAGASTPTLRPPRARRRSATPASLPMHHGIDQTLRSRTRPPVGVDTAHG